MHNSCWGRTGAAGSNYGSAPPTVYQATAGPLEMTVKCSQLVFFAVGTGCDKGVFPKTDKLPWETIIEVLTSIQGLTGLVLP